VRKFLGFEQVWKNSLTTLPIGGSEFLLAGESDADVMRCCQSLTLELGRHIVADTDVPAGDLGVGCLFGMYKRVRKVFTGVVTGSGIPFGGLLIRPKATGFGLVDLVAEMLESRGDAISGERVIVSESGNVSWEVIIKLIEVDAIPFCCSDSNGVLLFRNGMKCEHVEAINTVKSEFGPAVGIRRQLH
jgi:glutamate dehydrogenase (NADP+)